MDTFERQFGTYNAEEGRWVLDEVFLSRLTSYPFIGFLIGVPLGCCLSSHFGRRKLMCIISACGILTAAVTVGSGNQATILTGRILNYCYAGLELAVVPIFQSEIAPKQVRGLVIESYSLMHYFGGFIMSLLCFWTSTFEGNKQWRIPFACFFLAPAIIILGISSVPESPRWLLIKGRDEDAMEALRKLRAGRFTEDQIRDELEAAKAMLAQEMQSSWWDLIKGPNLKRTLITCGVNVFLQCTGNTFASRFGTKYVKSLRLENVDPYIMTIYHQLAEFLGVMLSMILVDIWGRRAMLFCGGTIQAVALLTMASLDIRGTSPKNQRGILAMFSLAGLGLSLG